MSEQISLDSLFFSARSHRKFLDKSLPENTLKKLYDLLKWGPTSANSCPARFLFVTSAAAKKQLAEYAAEGNRERILSAPATVVIATDNAFYEQLPLLAPHMPQSRDAFAANESLAKETAFRSGTLQGAYLIIAARALGLDCAPMSGFNSKKVDEAFFSDTSWSSNFICCIGYGDESTLKPRAPRLRFEQACIVV